MKGSSTYERACKVLVILGHPRTESFGGALANAYAQGARSGGAEVQELVLARLQFEPNVLKASPSDQYFEPDVQRAQELIAWADHLVFVYPTWWGTVPALMKAFFDRTLTPGFAFVTTSGGIGFEPRLRGKSAHLITTMDTPAWVYRWLYRQPGHNALRFATLGFCGIQPVRATVIGPVHHSTIRQRERWLNQVYRVAYRVQHGRLSRWQRFRIKASTWGRAARLQFYPMTWLAYSVGALAAVSADQLSLGTYWIGYASLFFLEMATVLANDYYDYESDRQNAFYSMFSGGSRVLVNGDITRSELSRAITIMLVAAGTAAGIAVYLSSASVVGLLAPWIVLAVLAMGYTVPPLKFSHRGLGELVVAATHSWGVILCGYVWQGGAATDQIPWLLGFPLFLAVLPAIILAGVPDYNADRKAGKRTLVVKLQPRRARYLAMAATIAAMAIAAAWSSWSTTTNVFRGITLCVLPHGLWLLYLMHRYREKIAVGKRIDALLACALAFILWFAVFPLFRLF